MITTLFPRDWGFLDYINSRMGRTQKDSRIGEETYSKFSDFSHNGEDTWACFLPWRMGIQRAIKLGLIPQNRNLVVYEVPVGIVHPNPKLSRKILMALARDFLQDFSGEKKPNILAYSIGNYPAFYIANTFPINRLISVVPSGKLGAALWHGIATQEVRRRSEIEGIQSSEQYDSIIGETNPISNVRNLPNGIEMHLATHDRYIPIRFGEELLRAVEDAGKSVKVYRNYGRGHVLTLLRFRKRCRNL